MRISSHLMLQSFYASFHIAWQKQPSKWLYKKAVLTNFAKFTGKHLLSQLYLKKSLFFNKVGLLTPAKEFPCEFCKIFKNIFFTIHLQWLFPWCSLYGGIVLQLFNNRELQATIEITIFLRKILIFLQLF